jgi:hypothetical protein
MSVWAVWLVAPAGTPELLPGAAGTEAGATGLSSLRPTRGRR